MTPKERVPKGARPRRGLRSRSQAPLRLTAWAAWLVLLIGVGGTAPAIGADLQEAQRDAITAIVFDSAITLRAKERQASKEIRELYERLEALHSSALSVVEKHRRELSIKDRIISTLEAGDRVYAAQIAAFKGSLQELSATPEVASILLTYQRGDKRAALAELEALIATRHLRRTAAAQALYVADLRAEAALALDAADKGEIEQRLCGAKARSVGRPGGR